MNCHPPINCPIIRQNCLILRRLAISSLSLSSTKEKKKERLRQDKAKSSRGQALKLTRRKLDKPSIGADQAVIGWHGKCSLLSSLRQ